MPSTPKTPSLWLRAVFCLAISLASAAVAAQGPIGTPGTPAPKQGGGSRGGFGLSIDLGSLFKAVQSIGTDERYSSPETASLAQYEPRQLVLAFSQDKQAGALALVQASGGTLQSSQNLGNLGITVAVVVFPNDADSVAALPALLASGTVTASRHAIGYPMQSSNANAAVPGKQYALELIKAPAQAAPKIASAITVGMIDTDVTNANSLNLANFKAKRLFGDTDKAAAPDHGNAVAAIMAASGNGFEGLAQGVSLRAASVMREVSPGINATNTMMVAQALDWLVGEKVQVANLSLGSAPDAVLATAISKAQAAGMLVVAAAGNGGPQAAPSFPAAYPGVIAATALDAQKRIYTRANRGTYVAIAAPGVDVWVPLTADGGQVKGKYMSGTSFASPFIAAVVARELASQPKATAQSMLQTLCSKAANVGATQPEAGCGLVQM